MLVCYTITSDRIVFYQMALKLHKLLNENTDDLNFEQITVLDQSVRTKRQVHFEVYRNCSSKIGINTTANKLYPLSKIISLNMLCHDFVYFKKMAKVQFLKYGKT